MTKMLRGLLIGFLLLCPALASAQSAAQAPALLPASTPIADGISITETNNVFSVSPSFVQAIVLGALAGLQPVTSAAAQVIPANSAPTLTIAGDVLTLGLPAQPSAFCQAQVGSTTVTPQKFVPIPGLTVTTNVGGGTWANGGYTTPYAGAYMVSVMIRRADNAPANNIAVGFGTAIADGPSVIWYVLTPSSALSYNRTSVCNTHAVSCPAGAVLTPFVFADKQETFSTAIATLTYVGPNK